MAASDDLGKSSTGLDPNVAGLLSYVFGFITGIVFLVLEKDNKFVRFHAMQSTAMFLGLFVASWILVWIPVLGWMVLMIAQLAALIAWIICMIKAFQKEYFKIPVIGDFAAKQVGL